MKGNRDEMRKKKYNGKARSFYGNRTSNWNQAITTIKSFHSLDNHRHAVWMPGSCFSLDFFQLIWQINLQQAEHKMQPGKENSSKLYLSKTLGGTVYFMWSNKKKLTLSVFSEGIWYKGTASPKCNRPDHMKKGHIKMPPPSFVYHFDFFVVSLWGHASHDALPHDWIAHTHLPHSLRITGLIKGAVSYPQHSWIHTYTTSNFLIKMSYSTEGCGQAWFPTTAEGWRQKERGWNKK